MEIGQEYTVTLTHTRTGEVLAIETVELTPKMIADAVKRHAFLAAYKRDRKALQGKPITFTINDG